MTEIGADIQEIEAYTAENAADIAEIAPDNQEIALDWLKIATNTTEIALDSQENGSPQPGMAACGGEIAGRAQGDER